MVDTEKLRKAISNFEFYSKPSSGTGSDPCTVEDINKVIKNVANMLYTFVDELEKEE